MLYYYLLNFCLLFTLTVLIFWPHIHAEKPEPLVNYPTLSKLLLGLKFGAVGLLTTWVSFPYHEGVLINALFVPLLFCGLLGGPIAMLAAGFIISLGRMMLFEVFPISTLMMNNFFAVVVIISIFTYFKPIHYHTIHRYLFFILAEISVVLILTAIFCDTSYWKILHISLFSWLIFLAIKTVLVQSQYARGKVELALSLDQKDYLTQLPNNYAIEAKLKHHALHEQSYAFLFIVIDHFKQFNVDYGYLVGDSILKELAHILKQFAQENEAQIGRLSGEEFCCILKDTQPALAVYKAEKLRQLIERHEFGKEHNLALSVTISVGVTNVPDNAATPEAIFKTANRAISKSNSTHYNYVCHINQYNKS